MPKFSYYPVDEDDMYNDCSYVTSEKIIRKKPRKSQF